MAAFARLVSEAGIVSLTRVPLVACSVAEVTAGGRLGEPQGSQRMVDGGVCQDQLICFFVEDVVQATWSTPLRR